MSDATIDNKIARDQRPLWIGSVLCASCVLLDGYISFNHWSALWVKGIAFFSLPVALQVIAQWSALIFEDWKKSDTMHHIAENIGHREARHTAAVLIAWSLFVEFILLLFVNYVFTLPHA
jgi:hypothetical protein